jgi:hypothetical protein
VKSFLSKSRCQLLAAATLAALLLPAVADATVLPPSARDTVVETDEDVPLDFALDVSGFFNLPTFTTDAIGPLGTIAGTTANALQFLPARNANGEVTVNYTAYDREFFASALLTIRIRPVNDVPIATGGEISLFEDSSVAILIDGNDPFNPEDPEGDSVIFVLLTPPVHGTLALDSSTRTYRYTPDPNYFGVESLTYTVGDGLGSTQAKIRLKIDPVPDAPVAAPVADLTMNEDSVGTQTVSATDADGGTLTYLLDAAPPVGRFSLDSVTGSVSFTPPTNYVGTVTYTWHATDGFFSSTGDTVSIVVVPVNDDDDSDTILDGSDNCPLVSNSDQANLDSDGSGDLCDLDDDGDTVADLDDACPTTAGDGPDGCPTATDTDTGTGTDTGADTGADTTFTDTGTDPGSDTGPVAPDSDGDGVPDSADNCRTASNADQTDRDRDGIGDRCDRTKDGGVDGCACDNGPSTEYCSTGGSGFSSTLLMALFAVVGLLWRRKPVATVSR